MVHGTQAFSGDRLSLIFYNVDRTAGRVLSNVEFHLNQAGFRSVQQRNISGLGDSRVSRNSNSEVLNRIINNNNNCSLKEKYRRFRALSVTNRIWAEFTTCKKTG